MITNLYNRVMPFLNYEIGDTAVAGTPCSCGRGLHTISRIEGRTGELFHLPGGGTVSEAAVNPMVRTLNLPNGSFRELQLVQTAPDGILIRVVPTEKFTSVHRKRIKEHFSKMLSGMNIRTALVDSIELSPSGKRPLIIPLERYNETADND